MCKYNEESGFWDWDRKRCPLCLGQYSNLHLIFHPHPPPPKLSKRDSHATDQPLAGTHSLLAKANIEVHNNRTTTRTNTQFLHATDHKSDYYRFVQYGFTYIVNISAHFKTRSNLEHATHHNPLQCNRFVLHGLAYLLCISGNLNYIQPTHCESLSQSQCWNYILQLCRTHFLCPMCQSSATTITFLLFKPQPALVRKVCPMRGYPIFALLIS
jgi:hypothetical protein